MKNIFKVSFMKDAHTLAKSLSKFNDKSYRENLSLALKARHLQKRGMGKNDVHELNWIKNNIPSPIVKMRNIQDFKRDSRYSINVYYNQVEIKQYLVVDQSYMNSLLNLER